jgi:hypothetical protein
LLSSKEIIHNELSWDERTCEHNKGGEGGSGNMLHFISNPVLLIALGLQNSSIFNSPESYTIAICTAIMTYFSSFMFISTPPFFHQFITRKICIVIFLHIHLS